MNATANELEKTIRENCPPPKDPMARDRYEAELREWLAQSDAQRAVRGFASCANAWDATLSY